MFTRKIVVALFLFHVLFGASVGNAQKSSVLTVKMIDKCLDRAMIHAKNMAKSMEGQDNVVPRTKDANGKLVTSIASWWTSGFYAGELWYLYEYSKDKEMLKLSENFTNRLESQQYNKTNHDVGFMLNCSFGNGYRLTGNKKYADVLETGAKSLMTRFNPKIGLIRSWDGNKNKWQYPVIIDNMMNLEMLLWVGQKTHNDGMQAASISHANKTMKYHFRPDNSCFHLVSYDSITGLPHLKQTVQGLNDSSAWARGQGWALYGFTMMYRFTKDKRYLDHAVKVAEFLTHHPAMPADKIPLWDYNAAADASRDASAAAIMASGLIELSQYVPEKRNTYLDFAKDQLIELTSDRYFAKENSNANFLLMHSVGHMPAKSEIDNPSMYADYYFVEGLMRYKKVLKGQHI